MNNTSLFLSVCFCLSALMCRAQHLSEYVLNMSKQNKDEANMHVCCSFVVDFQESDSIVMNFGGDKEISIENLSIYKDSSSLKHHYYPEVKKLVLKGYTGLISKMKIEYNYANLSAFFIYGNGKAELWETSYDEYYYPYLPNTYTDMTINLELPDSLVPICSYPMPNIGKGKYQCTLKGILQQSLSLAFLKKNAYVHTKISEPYNMDVYQIKGMQCDQKRYNELVRLANESISFFSKVYGEEYLCQSRGITSYPAFVFHDGKGFSNRYNIGFISASQHKFSTYPDIYPLVHEIGHRWLGEWTLLIDDGKPGAYFIKESLNEFMTLMFLRYYYGNNLYQSLIKKCKLEYMKIKNTPEDEPILNIVTNNNNTIIYYKGPLILDRFAEEIGYDNCINIISLFYQNHAGKPHLEYTDFIRLINKTYPQAADKLINQIEN